VSWWTWAWLGWGVIFCIIEGMALFNSKPGDTLSEHAWAWLGYNAMTGHDPLQMRHPSGWTYPTFSGPRRAGRSGSS
jgi:hypothetical protein